MVEPPAVPGATDSSGQATVTTYSYDPDGHVIQTLVTNQAVTTNPVGKTTVTYDALGRPVQKQENGGTKTDGSGGVQLLTTTYVHDADGRTTSTTDPNGQTTTATLDQLGQVTVLSRPDGTDAATYDKAGHTIQTSNSNGHTIYTYDALWRVIKEQHYDASGALISTTSHAYDAAGHELQPITTLANGTQTGFTYSYDALGRIATISDNARTYSYDPNGLVDSMSVYSDPAKTSLAYQASYGYDAGARTSTLADLVGPTATALHRYSYSYDTANNITSVADAIGGASSSYTYDNLNQLKTVTDSTGTTTFSYDANHNRQTMVAVVAGTSYTTSYIYDLKADQELLSKTDPATRPPSILTTLPAISLKPSTIRRASIRVGPIRPPVTPTTRAGG